MDYHSRVAADLTREFELLRLSVRYCLFGSPARTNLEPSLIGVDWSLVLWLGHQHGVLLHLLEAVDTVGDGVCPGAVLNQLGAHRRANAFRRLSRAREIRRLHGEFDRLGVPVIAVSGWAFSTRHYPTEGLRTIGGATRYLVRARDRERVEARLRALGYPAAGEPLPSNAAARSFVLVRDDTTWPPGRRASASNRRAAQVWDRVEPVLVGDSSVMTLSPVDWLLHMSARCAARPLAVHLRLAHDVMAVLHGSPSLDWSLFLREASRLDITAQCVVGVASSCDLLDQERPAAIQEIIDLHPRLATVSRAMVASSRATPGGRRHTRTPPMRPVAETGSLSRYAPTPHVVANAMLRLADVGPSDTVYDLGCGDGRIVIAAARDYGARGVGVEIDPAQLVEARAAAAAVCDRVSFIAADMRAIDLSEASVVCVYLPAAAYDIVGRLLRRSLSPGARIVSHGVAFPGWPPTRTEIVTIDPAQTSLIYAWTIPERGNATNSVTTSTLGGPSTMGPP